MDRERTSHTDRVNERKGKEGEELGDECERKKMIN